MKNLCRILPIALLFSICATYANALNCFDRSPTSKNLQNPYPPLKVRELTKEENESLKATFKSLHGDWRVTGEYEICSGSYDSPEQKIIKYILRARLETDHYGSFTMRVEVKAVRGVNDLENFSLYLTGKELRAGDYTDFGKVELIKVSPTLLSYRQLVLVQKVPLKRETFTTIQMSPIALSIDRTFYLQGRLVGHKVWRFKKN